MIIVWLFVLRWQKMVWKIYREVWKNEDFWVKNSTFHNRCRDNKGLIVSTPPVWLHYTIKTCVIGMPVTVYFCPPGVYVGSVQGSVHRHSTPHALYQHRRCLRLLRHALRHVEAHVCGWEREREGGWNPKNYDCLFNRFLQMGILFSVYFLQPNVPSWWRLILCSA